MATIDKDQLAELASELLRLQEQTSGLEPRRTGAFSPEALRRWTEVSHEPQIKSRDLGGTVLSSPTLSHNDYEQFLLEKAKVETGVELINAELTALRKKHEEEKSQLTKTATDLRRRNEELEKSLVTLQHQRQGRSDPGESETSNGRSASRSQLLGEGNIGFRMRDLAQRLTTPHPRGVGHMSASTEVEEERQATHEDCRQFELCEKEIQPTIPKNDESVTGRSAALEEKLRQSEQRANILEQRLVIVKESGDAVIRSLNEELEDVAQDRARSETAMIKELSLLDSQRRVERDEYETRIKDWINHDANRKVEVEEYETRIQSLLGTVQMMGADATICQTNSSSRDMEAEEDMYKDLVEYIQLLASNGKGESINDAFNLCNANPICADKMVAYYSTRAELKEFTLKSELPRMDYEVFVVDETTGNDAKLVSTDEIRTYFSSLDEATNDDEEIEILIRAANQSLLADPLAILTGESGIVHSGTFHSTVIATMCSFKLDLRLKGERRLKVLCELAVCVPSGLEANHANPPNNNDKGEKVSASLELARAQLLIQFSPSPRATPSGPLVKYHLVDIKPTIIDDKECSDSALRTAAAALARDRHSHIQSGKKHVGVHSVGGVPNVKSRFLSKVKQFSSSHNRS